MPFDPHYRITPTIAANLMAIEAARQAVELLPINATVIASLRETARLYSTHYSTMIEGNRLTQEQVGEVISHTGHFPGRERDEHEVLGYYAALDKAEQLAQSRAWLSETNVRLLHAFVMSAGKIKVKPTPYRDGQNVIRDSATRRIVYLPPEANDVPILMRDVIAWLKNCNNYPLPTPIQAAIAHYQFATVHPYYDGNGRTARLFTTLILHAGGYGLKGLYSLEGYYARNLPAYYAALSIGPSHNYYEGRATADITPWIDYFTAGMAQSFDAVKMRALEAAETGAPDRSNLFRKLDPRQREALLLYRKTEAITSRDLQKLFQFSQRSARNLLAAWTKTNFLIIRDPAKKSRKYELSPAFRNLAD
jgi:Fic family protein